MTALEILCRGILHGEEEKKHYQRSNQLGGERLVTVVLGMHEHDIAYV